MTNPQTSTLAGTADAVPAWARDAELAVMPAAPIWQGDEGGWVVHIEDQDMTAQDFIVLARAADAKLLYVDQQTFELEDLELGEEQLQEGYRHQVDQLREQARPYVGQTMTLTLAFTSGGVLHRWLGSAEWYEELLERRDTLLPAQHLASPDEDDLPLDEVERLARDLAGMPEFRFAKKTEQGVIARTLHPKLKELYEQGRRYDIASIVREAQDLVAVAAADAYAQLRPRMGELAAQLAVDPEYMKANNQNLRRCAAQRFLAREVGGYRPTTEDRDLLLAEMPQKPRLAATQDDALIDYI